MMKKSILLIPALFYSCFLYAFSNFGNIELMTVKDGLNNNTVYNVHDGKDHFIWLSTDVGISRYDGFRFRNFPFISDSDSALYLFPKPVRYVKEAPDGWLFLQLCHGGIACFDPKRERYLPVRADSSFSLKSVHDMHITSDRTLFLATPEGLYAGKVVLTGFGDKEGVACRLSGEAPLLKGGVKALCPDGRSGVLAATADGKIWRYDAAARRMSELKIKLVEDPRATVTKLEVVDDYLWVCYTGGNVCLYHLKTAKSRFIRLSGRGMNASNSYVTGIAPMDARTCYLTTWKGLYRLEFSTKELVEATVMCRSLIPKEYQSNFQIESKMTGLAWDREQKMLWVGTFGGGVIKFDLSEEVYQHVEQDLGAEVNGMVEDSRGFIWLSTDKGELWKSADNTLSDSIRFLPWQKVTPPVGKYLIYKDGNGRLWLGDNGGNIVCIHPVTEEIAYYALRPDGRTDFSAVIRQFCLDSRERLWIATSEGLILADSHTGKCSLIRPENEKIESCLSIAEDKEGNIWLGTEKGLRRVEISGDKIVLIGGYEKKYGLEASPVYSIYVNSYNQILASYANKIIRIDGRKKDAKGIAFTLLGGLNGHVYCMVDDRNGNTWVGSNSGIMTIRNDQSSFYTYSFSGNCNHVCRLKDGRLLWTKAWGLIFFDPLAVKNKETDKRLVLSELWVKGEPVEVGEKINGQVLLTTVPERQNRFVFHAGNNDFAFCLSDLRYGMMQRKVAYRLFPTEEEWRQGSLENPIAYSHVPVGKYSLQVKLVYPDATEGALLEIPIVIKAYWWKTPWAYLSYALLLGVLCYGGYLYFVMRSRRRAIHANREILLREKLKLERIKQEQKKEIDAMRTQLLTLFMQELRTPLSLIIAPLKEMLKDKMLSADLASKLKVAYRNSVGMLDACNLLLGIYTQGALLDKLEIAPYSVGKLIDSTLFGISELLRIHPIDFRYEKKGKDDLEIWADRKKVDFLLHNLLSNAFIHIRYSGVVTLSVRELEEEDGVKYCCIQVSDSGHGILYGSSENESDDWQTDLSRAELGMSAMRKTLEVLHGSIRVETGNNEGTTVRICLPMSKEMFLEDTNVRFIEPETWEEEIQPVEEQKPEETAAPASGEEVVAPDGESAIPARSKKTLLIVEDHKDIRLYLKVLFGNEYNTLMAVNGQEGVELAKRERPDLVICDVMMPLKDGFECCKEVKEDLTTCHIPFIMLTAKVEDEDVLKGLESGVDDYILKPFTPSILKAKVRSLINGRLRLKQMYTRLLSLSGNDGTEGTPEKEEEAPLMENPFIASVIKIIEENLCESDFSVKKLAADLNMSQPTLYRKVKQSTDFTIIELIRGVRMRKAAQLLKLKQYSVQEVVEMVGYNDIPTFRKHFVDTFGTTPSTYEG